MHAADCLATACIRSFSDRLANDHSDACMHAWIALRQLVFKFLGSFIRKLPFYYKMANFENACPCTLHCHIYIYIFFIYIACIARETSDFSIGCERSKLTGMIYSTLLSPSFSSQTGKAAKKDK